MVEGDLSARRMAQRDDPEFHCALQPFVAITVQLCL
jgi:hypothetical protein